MTTDTTLAQPLLNKLQWRYAAKKMNPAKKVPQEKVERILEAGAFGEERAGAASLLLSVRDKGALGGAESGDSCKPGGSAHESHGPGRPSSGYLAFCDLRCARQRGACAVFFDSALQERFPWDLRLD